MDIRIMDTLDSEKVAKIHIESIDAGFISSLGLRFVKALYKRICLSKKGFVYVADDKGDIKGFIAGTEDVNKMYKEVLLRGGFLFVIILIRKVFSLSALKRIFQTLFYPAKVEKEFCKAEILSVGVKGDARGKGVGSMLMESALNEFRKRDVAMIKALTHDINAASNHYYQKQGYQLKGTVKHHENTLNIYCIELDQNGENKDE